MITTTQTLLLICFVIRSSVTVHSIDLCSNVTLNYYNNDTTSTFEDCGCEECIRKCCQKGFSYYHASIFVEGQLTGECKKDDDLINFSIPIYEGDKKVYDLFNGFKTGIINCTNLVVTKWYPECSEPTIYIQRNGTFYFTGFDTIVYIDEYCVDAKDGIPTYYYCSTQNLEEVRSFLRSVEIVPIPFLLLTFVVFAILPERNIHRKALMCHTLLITFGYVLLVINNLFEIKVKVICLITGYLVIYCFFTANFWINVMCIDIWLAFGGLQRLQRRISKYTLFIAFCIYAFGVNGLSLLMVFAYRATSLSNTGKYCPFDSGNACYQNAYSFLYNFINTTFLCVFNTVLFILTTINIRRIKKETAMLKHADSGRHASEIDEKYTMYWNLLCIMGYNPFCNYLYLFQEIFSKSEWLNINVYMTVTTVANGFYGPLVFVVFVCKKRIWNELQQRYYQLARKPKPNASRV